jgi:hypothetical protein
MVAIAKKKVHNTPVIVTIAMLIMYCEFLRELLIENFNMHYFGL